MSKALQSHKVHNWFRTYGALLERVLLWIGLVITGLAFAGSYLGLWWGLICGRAAAVAALVNLVLVVFRLDDRVSDLRSGGGRKQFGLMFEVTLWIVLVGVFAETLFTSDSAWNPLKELATSSLIIGTLLGMATLLALIVTLTEVRQEQIPRAMGVAEVLDVATKFIEEETLFGCEVRMCSYYPNIGAANQDDYSVEYRRFKEVLESHNVLCVSLKRESADKCITADSLRKRSMEVIGTRPEWIEDSLAAFSTMWDPRNDDNLTKARKMFSTALHDIDHLIEYPNGRLRVRDLYRPTKFVPDFHFIVAGKKGDDTPHRGLLIIPLMPAGMHGPEDSDDVPPMISFVVIDRVILWHLLQLWQRLESNGCPGVSKPRKRSRRK